jgi:TonB family protein
VYQAPDFGNGWPSKALQIVDQSDSIGYNVEVKVYCTGIEYECATYVAAQIKSILAPRPNSIPTDIAYKQWRNRIKQEACIVRPANLSTPRYPPQALRNGIGGTVRIGFIYNSCGNVRDTWIDASSRNRDLDRAALNEALKWQIDISALPEGTNTGAAIAPVVFSAE